MRPLPVVTGLLIAAVGLVGTIAGEVNANAWWLLAAAAALIGVTGLINVMTAGDDTGPG